MAKHKQTSSRVRWLVPSPRPCPASLACLQGVQAALAVAPKAVQLLGSIQVSTARRRLALAAAGAGAACRGRSGSPRLLRQLLQPPVHCRQRRIATQRRLARGACAAACAAAAALALAAGRPLLLRVLCMVRLLQRAHHRQPVVLVQLLQAQRRRQQAWC